MQFDTDTDTDDAADTLRFVRFDEEAPTNPDATSFYDLTTPPTAYLGIQRASAARRRLIRATRQDIVGLRDTIDAGWDVGSELEHEERS